MEVEEKQSGMTMGYRRITFEKEKKLYKSFNRPYEMNSMFEQQIIATDNNGPSERLCDSLKKNG